MSENDLGFHSTIFGWSCIFCKREFYIEFVDYPKPAGFDEYRDSWAKAIKNDVEQHMYIEVKEYMMSKNQYPTEEKAFYVLSEDPENILKYIDNYLEFKEFCYKKRMAERLLSI